MHIQHRFSPARWGYVLMIALLLAACSGETANAVTSNGQWKVQSRGPLVADLPADLIGLYDKVRDASGGLGAALLRFGRCEGCRLELSGSAKSEVRAAAPDDVVRCEECRRILVRTEESGL